jgi:phosphatidate phosphatase APP1
VDELSSQGNGAPSQKAHGASRFEDWYLTQRARWARTLGHREQIVPFTGYGTTTQVRIFCRVLLTKTRTTRRGKLKKIRGWRSFTSVPVANARVHITINGSSLTLEADRGGVIDHVIPVTLSAGWHNLTLRTDNSEPASAKVTVVSPKARVGVICDIDDTVMVTALPRPLLAAWNSFVRDEHARSAVPGMAVLMERLVRDNPGAPVIYLSTGAWNVAPTLHRFLTRHLFPIGPLLLTDWGPTPDRWFRSGREHKATNLERLATEFPGIRWILIGDDGQHDEEIYADFAARHPKSVRAIAIRELLAPEAILAGGRHHVDKTQHPERTPWVSAPNGAGLAGALGELGVINPSR